MTKQGLLDIYGLFGWISIGVAVLVLLVSPIVKRWMHLDTLEDDTQADIHDTEVMAGYSELAEPIAPGINTDPEFKAGEGPERNRRPNGPGEEPRR